ncbi:MAG: tyrosine-type recombinase/integrase [Bacteroidetes bacterium]|nr:tyrosine-type recombinase/integrase [Bacteroidota bacterium]
MKGTPKKQTLDSYLRGQYTEKTAVAYAREIDLYLTNCPQAASATYATITAYIGRIRSKYRPSTVNRILSSIKAYYSYLCATGERTDHPAASIELKDQRRRDIQLQDLLRPEELETLLARTERYPNLEGRNKVLVSLLMYQALLPAEMEQLRAGDIDLEAGTVYIRPTGKTSGRELSLKPSQVLLFYRYIREERPRLLQGRKTEALLVGIRGGAMAAEDITKHVKRSYQGLYPGRPVTAQTVRQSVLANLLKQGHDVSVVQVFAGHRYPGSTERYRQDDVATLAAAVRKYHPFG